MGETEGRIVHIKQIVIKFPRHEGRQESSDIIKALQVLSE